MKNCPNCGANVEGLISRCDCCGAMLAQIRPVFVQYINTVASAGTLSVYMKRILDKLNFSGIERFFPQFHTIAFEIYCYPKDMLQEYDIHSKNYVSLRRKKAIITRIVFYREFLSMNGDEIMAQLSELVIRELLNLRIKMSNSGAEELEVTLRRLLHSD